MYAEVAACIVGYLARALAMCNSDEMTAINIGSAYESCHKSCIAEKPSVEEEILGVCHRIMLSRRRASPMKAAP